MRKKFFAKFLHQ